MPDMNIGTEMVEGICKLVVAIGTSVGDGDDIAFIDVIKM